MKYKKITIILFLSIFIVLISSKSPDLHSTPCHQEQATEATITILLPNGPISFRKPGYEYYIPTPDLRTSPSTHIPAGWESEINNFYCIVTVTAPNCTAWSWEGALSQHNRNHHNMTIKTPHPFFTAFVTVEYYEIADQQGAIKFNKTVSGDFFAGPSRIKYRGTTTLVGGRKPAQLIQMKPIENILVPLNISFEEFHYSKEINLIDHTGINDVIANKK